MKQLSYLITALFISITTYAKPTSQLTAQWLGVAGIEICDEETCLIFDPIATKPTLIHWIFNAEFLPQPEKANQLISRLTPAKRRALFISHTHFDHAVDAPLIAKTLDIPIYGGPSVLAFLSYWKELRHFRPLKPRAPISVGKFKISVVEKVHPTILNILDFAPGKIDSSFRARLYDYQTGEMWAYRIDHSGGSIFIDQSSHQSPESLSLAKGAKAYFVGVANKVGRDQFVDENVLAVHPKFVIPLHQDFFLLDWPWADKNLFEPLIGLEALQKRTNERSTDIRWIMTEKFKKFDL